MIKCLHTIYQKIKLTGIIDTYKDITKIVKIKINGICHNIDS